MATQPWMLPLHTDPGDILVIDTHEPDGVILVIDAAFHLSARRTQTHIGLGIAHAYTHVHTFSMHMSIHMPDIQACVQTCV